MDIFDDIQSGAEGLSEVGVHAGFPNPAAGRDHQRATLSLDQLLVSRPSSTYFFRIKGHQWSDQGIYDGDLAIVDRAARVLPHDMVVAWQDNFILSRRDKLNHAAEIWGVITAIVHSYRQQSSHNGK